ncbi:MAG: peptidase M19 [Verrucomicrobia bacterium]|nr:MAG: peptidase M19 [Verrucomicrobiota bacterium]
MLIFDAHLDLAMNALEWNRDLTRSIGEIREREKGMADKPDRGKGTVCLPEMRRGGVGLCVATLIARIEHNAYSPVFGWRSQTQAWAQTQGQLAWYRAMEEAGQMAQIKDAAGLEKHVKIWEDERVGRAGPSPPRRDQTSRPADHAFSGTSPSRELPIGYILSLEGADSIVTLKHLERAYEHGLRAIGPAHYGPGVYAKGTDASGGFNAEGRELLEEMERLGMILDVTHLCDDCFWEALDLFQGPAWASHQNCRSLVPHNRQFSDEQIKALIERGAVIGAALDAWMMVPGWIRRKTTPEAVGLKLERIIDHIDHVCQIAGNARHSGIGSDLDGAFGREQTPMDLDTIADLANIPGLLAARGYKPADIELIGNGNFVRFLREAWK